MADTFSQIYVQIIFAVQGRANLIQQPFRSTLFEYIPGIIRNKNQKPIIVNGYADHVMPLSDSLPVCGFLIWLGILKTPRQNSLMTKIG